MNNIAVELIEIPLNPDLQQLFHEKRISDIHLRLLLIICDQENKIFDPWNLEPHRINIIIIENLFPQIVLDADLKSIPRDKIAEFAAVGHIFSYLLLIRPNISDIEVLNPPDDGYDFLFKENGEWKKLEISGVNSDQKNTFSKRISEKRNKFKDKEFTPPAPTEELIGIVDFHHLRYTLWDILQSLNYKNRGS